MKPIIRVLCGVTLLLSSAAPVLADTYVRGYTRSNGTYVQPHYRSDADSNPYNNWSTRGNVNPYTGQPGTRSPDALDNGSREYGSPYSGPTLTNPDGR
jgi:hypothetical protein